MLKYVHSVIGLVLYCWLEKLGEFSFFFQAEDGIRDLVRSRGLGDVYKRQAQISASALIFFINGDCVRICAPVALTFAIACFTAVSYTHLTLPTSDLV